MSLSQKHKESIRAALRDMQRMLDGHTQGQTPDRETWTAALAKYREMTSPYWVAAMLDHIDALEATR